MTDDERIEAALKSVEWWDADLLVMAARGWYFDWRPQIARFAASQWGAARRIGAAARSYTQFCEAWQESLFGTKEPGGEHRGAVARDKKQRNWGQPRLAEDFLLAMSRASEQQESERARKFAGLAEQLGPRAAERLQSWRRLRQTRLFLDFLIMAIRADLDAKEKA